MNELLKKSLWAVAFSLVILAWVFGLFIDLTGDSGLHAAISRQMVESGDWLNLKINGEPYDQKPHLFFWLAGLGIQLFGNSNWAFKLFPFLVGVSGIYFTYRLGKLIYSELSGKLAALLAGTSQMFFLYFFDIHTDTVLQATVTLAIWQLAEYLENKKPVYFIFGFVGIGLAMLTKGPVGAVLPFFFVLFYLLLKKDFRQLFHPKWILGILLVLLIISPTLYHLWESFGAEGFHFYFIGNNFGRITGEVAGSSTDPFFYLYNQLWAFAPWTIVFITALGGEIITWFYAPKPRKMGISIFGSVLVLFVVYSIARGKAPNYMMMFIPLLAVLAGNRMKYFVLWPTIMTRKLIFAQRLIILLVLLAIPASYYLFPGNHFLLPLSLLISATTLIVCFRGIELHRWNRLIFATLVSLAFINLYLNASVIPNMFQYQGHSQTLEIFESCQTNEKQLFNFGLEEYELFFNAEKQVQNVVSWEELYDVVNHPGAWVYTNEDRLRKIWYLQLPIDTIYEINQRGMNRISPEFIHPKTREKSLSGNYLLKMKSIEDEVFTQGRESGQVLARQKLGFEAPMFHWLSIEQGIYFINIGRDDVYSPPAIIQLDKTAQASRFTLEIKLEYRAWSAFDEKEVVLVVSVENQQEVLAYRVFPLAWSREDETWKTDRFEDRFTMELPQNAQLKAYILNKNRNRLALKQMEITLTGNEPD